MDKKHQSLSDGDTIWEKDWSTVRGPIIGNFGANAKRKYTDGNFTFVTSNIPSPEKKHTIADEGDVYTYEQVSGTTRSETINNKQPEYNSNDLRSYAYFGSAYELVKNSIENIVKNFPPKLYTDHSSLEIPPLPGDDAHDIETATNKEGFPYYVLNNPFNVDFLTQRPIVQDGESPLHYMSTAYPFFKVVTYKDGKPECEYNIDSYEIELVGDKIGDCEEPEPEPPIACAFYNTFNTITPEIDKPQATIYWTDPMSKTQNEYFNTKDGDVKTWPLYIKYSPLTWNEYNYINSYACWYYQQNNDWPIPSDWYEPQYRLHIDEEWDLYKTCKNHDIIKSKTCALLFFDNQTNEKLCEDNFIYNSDNYTTLYDGWSIEVKQEYVQNQYGAWGQSLVVQNKKEIPGLHYISGIFRPWHFHYEAIFFSVNVNEDPYQQYKSSMYLAQVHLLTSKYQMLEMDGPTRIIYNFIDDKETAENSLDNYIPIYYIDNPNPKPYYISDDLHGFNAIDLDYGWGGSYGQIGLKMPDGTITPCWTAKKGKSYRMKIIANTSLESAYIPYEYVRVSLKRDYPDTKEKAMKYMKDVSPYVIHSYETVLNLNVLYIAMSAYVAKEIWEFDPITHIGKVKPKSQWGHTLEQSEILDWDSELTTIPNDKWYGGYDSQYEMFSEIYDAVLYSGDMLMNGGGELHVGGNSFQNARLYCEELEEDAQLNVSSKLEICNNGKINCKLIVDGQKTVNTYTLGEIFAHGYKFGKDSVGNDIIIPNCEVLKTLTKEQFKNNIVVYKGNLSVYSEYEKNYIQTEVPVLDKVLDSQIEFKSDKQGIVTNLDSLGHAYYAYMDIDKTGRLLYRTCPKDAPYAWTYMCEPL